MGQNKLGGLPRTLRWKHVIGLLEGDADTSAILDASFLAAERGLSKIPNDPGFNITLTDIFKFIEAARSQNYLQALSQQGFSVGEESTLMDLLGALRLKTDENLEREKAKSDLSELVQNSLLKGFCRKAQKGNLSGQMIILSKTKSSNYLNKVTMISKQNPVPLLAARSQL